MSRRQIPWNTALRDLKLDRATRAEVREERLRSTGTLYGSPSLALSAWRGRSKRKYVVGVHSLTTAAVEAAHDSVLIAVRRDAAGLAHLVDVATSRAVDDPAAWVAAAELDGANELHIHRVTKLEPGRLAIVSDLRAPAEVAA